MPHGLSRATVRGVVPKGGEGRSLTLKFPAMERISESKFIEFRRIVRQGKNKDGPWINLSLDLSVFDLPYRHPHTLLHMASVNDKCGENSIQFSDSNHHVFAYWQVSNLVRKLDSLLDEIHPPSPQCQVPSLIGPMSHFSKHSWRVSSTTCVPPFTTIVVCV